MTISIYLLCRDKQTSSFKIKKIKSSFYFLFSLIHNKKTGFLTGKNQNEQSKRCNTEAVEIKPSVKYNCILLFALCSMKNYLYI